jgi:ankyrin repeat protein
MDPGQSLVQAAAGGYLSLVRLFTTPSAGAAGGTEAVANVESRCHGYTALMAAAAGGHVEIVQHLLSLSSLPHTVSVEATHPSTGNTALFYAASHGFHQTAELLLLKGAAIDAVNSTLQTPLMVAAEKGHTHTVTFLLTRGAQINHHDAKGATSLLLAAAGGHASTVKVLLSKGAMKLIKNSEGYTALTIAEKMEYADCVALLSK